ncbi:hypothetical protein AGMMS50256_15450 [Betaproteobacteria bacterium]|nr:hypothetical protein AGMMS50256_15450 [Betaproteobacteria bacterium]
MSIRLRLILTFFVSLILSCGSISLIVFFFVRAASNESFLELAVSQLDRVEERIDTFMEPGIMSVKYLAGTDLVRNSRGKLTSYLDTTEQTPLLYANHPEYERLIYDEFLHNYNYNDNYDLVFMANNDGQYTQSPEGRYKAAGYDPRKRSWYKEAMANPGDVTITSPYLTTGAGVVCSILVKTFDEQGEPLGLLGVDYTLQSLTSDLYARRIMKTGYLVVFDANGRIISDGHHPEYTEIEPKDYPELRKAIAAAADGTMEGIGERGIDEYIVIKTMGSIGWKIAVIFEKNELMESPYSLLRIILLTTGVIFVLAFIAVALIARGIVHPIEDLIDASAIISSGEYENSETVRQELQKKLSVTGHGESKKLSVALEQMLKTLQDRIERAQQASRAKSDFLSNMSHEIRTPINAITGMTTIGKLAETIERKDYAFEKIGEASTHLLGVINDILDMSKIEANKLELSPAKFSFEKMLQKVEDVNIFRVDERRQKLTISVDKAIPRNLISDDQRLTQVITNLLSNAIKFTPEDGAIQINACLESACGDVCTIRIDVTDTGIGISEEQQTRLFQSFEQAQSSTSREFGGTGLGLAISRRIVEMMGGRIWIESAPGDGSTFSFTFNAVAAQDDEPERSDENAAIDGDPSDETNIFKGYRIILAEDVEINRLIVLGLLEETGIVIDCAENGVEAVELFAGNPAQYDMIFMDIQMPKMDGYDATKSIREMDLPYAKEIPIVAMTANVFREDIEKCLAVGMNGHVGKPIDIGEVLEKLRTFLKPRN